MKIECHRQTFAAQMDRQICIVKPSAPVGTKQIEVVSVLFHSFLFCCYFKTYVFCVLLRKHSLSRSELTGTQNTVSICISANCRAQLVASHFDPELERGNAPGKS